MSAAARNAGLIRAARSMSAISVPRPGPSSASTKGGGLAHHLPDRDRPEADQLAEDLADLRRGDEVAGAAERLAAHVVAVLGIGEAERHVVGDGDRPGGADMRRDLFGEAASRAFRRRRGAPRRDAQIIRPMPNRIIGIDSSMPMVSPPAR